MEVKEILKAIRKKRGLSAKQVAEASGITHGVYKKYESGEIGLGVPPLIKLANFYGVTTDYLLGREVVTPDILTQFVNEMSLNAAEEMLIRVFFAIPQNKREAFVKAFCEGIDEYTLSKRQSDLQATETAEVIEIPRKPIKTITLSDIGLSAGYGNLVLDSYGEEIEIFDKQLGKADVAFKVVGDSMNPQYQDGQIVYVRSQPQVEVGDIGAFLYDGMQFVKKFSQKDGVYVLESLNKTVDDDGNRIYPDIEIKDDSFRCYGKVLN